MLTGAGDRFDGGCLPRRHGVCRNPCGFSLLPVYIGLLFTEGTERSPSMGRCLGTALLIAMAVTAGFAVLFAAVGLLVGAGGQAITDFFPVVGHSVGVVLIRVGAYRLGGGLFYSAAPERLSARLGAGSTGARDYLLFGLTYGIASLSRTLPIFLAVLGGSLAIRASAPRSARWSSAGWAWAWSSRH